MDEREMGDPRANPVYLITLTDSDIASIMFALGMATSNAMKDRQFEMAQSCLLLAKTIALQREAQAP